MLYTSRCRSMVLLALVAGSCSWRWAGDPTLNPCDPTSVISSFSEQSTPERAAVFRACGVVGITSLLPAAAIDRFRVALNDQVAAALQSRRQLRHQLLEAMRHRQSLTALAEQVSRSSAEEEWAAYLWSGEWAKERNDGRIDISLPWSPPISSTAQLAIEKLQPLLHQILGTTDPESAELKRVNAVIGLTRNDSGIQNQHWHRDEPHLFAGVQVPGGGPVHERVGGVQLPPYALNIFVALTDLTPSNAGGTQFVLGSHMWADEWAGDEAAPPAGLVDWPEKVMRVPAGSVVISDYRTVHRGLANLSPSVRPLAMLVYGKSWWSDATNYGDGDYGGVVPLRNGQLGVVPATHRKTGEGASAEKAKRMFWGLVSKWEDGLVEQLQRGIDEEPTGLLREEM